jgi:lysophospholipase L1-like esterase
MSKPWEKLLNREKGFIVCIGDSITEQNYHAHGKLNYVGQLNERLLNKFGRKHLLLNAGVSDDTTWGIIERLSRDALRFQPSLVTLMIGMNDSTKGMERLQEFKNNLTSIVRQVRVTGIEMILITPNPINLHLPENAIRLCYPHYVDAIREIAASEQIPLCDVYQAWEELALKESDNQWSTMNDSIHPNEYGHDFIAQVLFRFLGISD